MTTIAWDGTTLAGDTLCVSYNLKREVQKIWRLADGRLYGGSGEYQGVLAVKQWLEDGEPDDKEPLLDDFSAMVIDQKGHAFRLESQLVYMPIVEPYFAVGSGRDFALAAMFLGKNAREAVELAALFDIYTGFKVETLTLTPQARQTHGLMTYGRVI